MHDVVIRIRATVLCIGLMLPTTAIGAEPDLLFSPLSQAEQVRFEDIAKVELKKDRTLIRMIGARLNTEVFIKNAIQPGLGNQPIRPFAVKLFEDVPVMTLITEQVTQSKPGSFEWVGHVEGDRGSTAVFVLKEGREGKPNMLAGSIFMKDKLYRIGSNPEGLHLIYEIDRSKIPDESPSVEVRPRERPARQQIHPIEMKLSDDLPVMTVITDRVEGSKQGYFKWHGHLEGDPKSSSVILMKQEGDSIVKPSIVGGVIRTTERIYRIGSDWPVPPLLALGPGDLPIVEVDPRKIVIPQLAGVKWWDSYPVCQIDVMVAYTPKAVAVSSADIDLNIDVAFTSAQKALDDSGINFKLNRVGEDEVKAFFLQNQAMGFPMYDDDGTIDNDLATLTSGSDPTGTIAKIHDIRNTVGADLVNLWIDSGVDGTTGRQSCGKANQLGVLEHKFEASAFSVVPRSGGCVDNRSFVHELAHNMGAYHDRIDEGFPTSPERWYGYISAVNGQPYNGKPYDPNDPNSQPLWGTIMALPSKVGLCSNGCRKFQFSNPDPSKNIGGFATGIAGPASNAADNHWTLNNAREIVAGFRMPAAMPGACASADVTPPAAPINLGVQ